MGLLHDLFEDEGAFGKVLRIGDPNALEMAFVDVEIVVSMGKDRGFGLPANRLGIEGLHRLPHLETITVVLVGRVEKDATEEIVPVRVNPQVHSSNGLLPKHNDVRGGLRVQEPFPQKVPVVVAGRPTLGPIKVKARILVESRAHERS